MAHHGLIPMMQDKLLKLDHKPSVLEVGVDRGVTTIPLLVALASGHDSFFYVGVDIKLQESLFLTVKYMGKAISSSTFFIEANSLEFLPKLVNNGAKFDLILLDGDHNYYTVSREMQHMDALLNKGGMIVVDDYNGKWSNRDMFYAYREGYEDVKGVTVQHETEKHGVQPAIDEWLENNPGWKLSKPIEGEPVILERI